MTYDLSAHDVIAAHFQTVYKVEKADSLRADLFILVFKTIKTEQANIGFEIRGTKEMICFELIYLKMT